MVYHLWGPAAFGKFIAIFYPTFKSWKALKTGTLEDDKTWLQYWVCFGLLNAVELVMDLAVGWFFPMYEWVKCAAYVFFFIPIKGGIGATLFMNKLKPLLDLLMAPIDIFFAETNAKVTENSVKEGIKEAFNSGEKVD